MTDADLEVQAIEILDEVMSQRGHGGLERVIDFIIARYFPKGYVTTQDRLEQLGDMVESLRTSDKPLDEFWGKTPKGEPAEIDDHPCRECRFYVPMMADKCSQHQLWDAPDHCVAYSPKEMSDE